MQWTLSQVEIEFIDFQMTLERSDTVASLPWLRQDFDILYSRVAILREGQLFAPVRGIDGFLASVNTLQQFLDQTAPYMDGPASALLAARAGLIARVDTLRPEARQLFVLGLSHFADQSDTQRERISRTLQRLSVVIIVSLSALGILFLYSRGANARTRERERALTRANAHMQTILSTSLDAVIVSDHQGRVLDLNAAAEATFGYSLDTARGQCIGDLIVPPELRAAHRAGLERMIATGEKKLVGHGRVRLEAVGAAGQRIPVELALQSASGEEGEVIIAFLRDISQQLAAEEELRTARDQALAGEKAKADFLTVMSHEIRTPLNGLLGNLTLMGQTRLEGDQGQFVRNMKISGRQLMKHVNAILDIAKFEAGKLTPSPTAFHLGRLLQDVVDVLSGQAERNQTAIEWGWEGEALTWVETDRAHLEQILMNLVGNAIKFTHGGQVRIEAEQCRGQDGTGAVEFRIIDTGTGIPEDDQTRIFEDFESRDMSHARTGSGTGLGLGISRRLVSVLGGEIGVESTPGEGSLFWFRLPMTEAQPPASAAPGTAPVPAVEPLSVLLAEDNEINAFVARRMLEQDGHQVTLAHDGLDAVAQATSTAFDVILMDISMPGMDGLEATEAIRAAGPPWSDVPVLAFSANVLPEDTDRFRSRGMSGFIGKPLKQSEIRRALQAVQARRFDPLPSTAPPEQPGGSLFDLLDADEAGQLTRDFLREGDTLVDELLAMAPDAPDFDRIIAECHRVSGSAALFEAFEFRDALRALESAARDADLPLCQAEITAVQDAWARDRARIAPG